VIHILKELLEIFLNLNSNQATCKVVTPDCFLIINNNDIKIDLFYMSIFEEFSINMIHNLNDSDS
jgi:hypothetical protein